jgi:hypothetical protein
LPDELLKDGSEFRIRCGAEGQASFDIAERDTAIRANEEVVDRLFSLTAQPFNVMSAASSHAGGAPVLATMRAAVQAVTACWKLKPPAPAAPPDVELGIVRFYGRTTPS